MHRIAKAHLLLALVFLLACPLAGMAQAVVQRIGGEPLAGRVVGLVDGQLRLAIGEDVTAIRLEEVVAIDFQRAAVAPREGVAELKLRNGDRLLGRIEEGNFDEVVIGTSAFGRVQILLDPVESVLLPEQAEGLSAATLARGAGPDDDELILRATGGVRPCVVNPTLAC